MSDIDKELTSNLREGGEKRQFVFYYLQQKTEGKLKTDESGNLFAVVWRGLMSVVLKRCLIM